MIESVSARRKSSNLGGARPGAGRPAELKDPKRVTFNLESKDHEALLRRAEREGRPVGELIREAVRRFLAGRRTR